MALFGGWGWVGVLTVLGPTDTAFTALTVVTAVPNGLRFYLVDGSRTDVRNTSI